MEEESAPSQIINSWHFIRRMLRDRGYKVDSMINQVDWAYVTRTVLNCETKIILSKINDPEEKIIVYFRREKKIGIKPLRWLVEWMRTNKIKRAIMFSPSGATPGVSKSIKNIKPLLIIEIQCYIKYCFCVIDHKLVPKHRILSPADKRNLILTLFAKRNWLLGKENYTPTDKELSEFEKFFPQQLEEDPVSEYYGLQKGEMIAYEQNAGSQSFSPYPTIIV